MIVTQQQKAMMAENNRRLAQFYVNGGPQQYAQARSTEVASMAHRLAANWGTSSARSRS